MAAKNSKMHVARKGAILGAYDRDKIGDLLETGHLRPTDHYFNDATGEWTELSTLDTAAAKAASSRPPASSSDFKSTEEPEQEEDPAEEIGSPSPSAAASSSRSSRRSGSSKGKMTSKPKPKKGATQAIVPWIACLFSLVVAVGIFAYAQMLADQITTWKTKAASLEDKIASLNKENQLISEITPPGRVRAVITYSPAPNQVAIMSGATLGLYKRQDVEDALKKLNVDQVNSDTQFDEVVNRLKSIIPSPMEITLTDSNGRVDLGVPAAGDYVLVASAAKATNTGTEKYFWLAGFRSNDQPSALILLNEKNAISLAKPQFNITNVRGMDSGL